MIGGGVSRRLALAVLTASALSLAACGRGDGTAARSDDAVTFTILSASGQASSEPQWRPLLEDMSKAIGAPVTPLFASSYSDLVEAMRDGRAQAGWFSARPAIQAIDEADAEVVARTVNPQGENSYRATLIVKKGAGLTLERVLNCDRSLRFGIGDPDSTSATLAPMTFLFNPRDIDPARCFGEVRQGNQQANAFAVAAGVLDVATSNSTTAVFIERQNPQIAEQMETIWQSPPVPEGGILVRSTLDPAMKEKIRAFLLAYGQGDSAEADRQRQVLAGLNYSLFQAADDSYLDPVRELATTDALAAARRSGDQTAIRTAQTQLQELRAKREVQP